MDGIIKIKANLIILAMFICFFSQLKFLTPKEKESDSFQRMRTGKEVRIIDSTYSTNPLLPN
jgi:hypothetical protein